MQNHSTYLEMNEHFEAISQMAFPKMFPEHARSKKQLCSLLLPRGLLHGESLSLIFGYPTLTFPFLFLSVTGAMVFFSLCLLSSRCATRGYHGRGAFEAVLADEDVEEDADRWCSYTQCGQELWQIARPLGLEPAPLTRGMRCRAASYARSSGHHPKNVLHSARFPSRCKRSTARGSQQVTQGEGETG
jgi:hypothetical protein